MNSKIVKYLQLVFLKGWDILVDIHQESKNEFYLKYEKNQEKNHFFEENNYWIPISYIKKIDKIENVYNIEVEDDNSYVVSNCIVHNCQGFSFSGKQLNFNDPRSALFFEYVRLVKEINPKYFILENVRMKKEYEKVISEYMGVEPLRINSNLVSAQNRPRLYWTNIKNVEQPKDKGLYFQDIMEKDIVADNFYYSDKAKAWIQRHSDRTGKIVRELNKENVKMQCLEATMHKKYSSQRFFQVTDKKGPRYVTPLECERCQTVPDQIKYVKIDLGDILCIDQVKNYVNVVEKNHKLLKLALSVERKELREYVKHVCKNMNANLQLEKNIVQENVDMQTQNQIEKCIKTKFQELNTNVKSVKKNVMSQNQNIEEGFVVQNVFMNLIEGRIIHNGKAELLLKDSYLANQKNGKNVLELSETEIMLLAKYAKNVIQEEKDLNFMYTISSHLDTKDIEQILIILYYYAKNVIDGCIAKKIKIKNLSLSLTNGYTFSVSNTQRYRMLGNGFTVDIIKHILEKVFKKSKN